MPEKTNPKIRPSTPPPGFVPPDSGVHIAPYAELDITTNFSFLRGASHPDELVYRAAELGYRAIAITDVNSLAGVVRMHQAAKQVKLKLLIGARLCLTDSPDILVWASDRAAYARLCRLLTLGKRRAEKGQCLIGLHDFLEHSDGLLAALVPVENVSPVTDIAREDTATRPAALGFISSSSRQCDSAFPLRILKQALGSRLSLAVSTAYGAHDAHRLRKFADLAREHGVPMLATHCVHYHDPSRRTLQDVLTCVRHGCTIAQAGYRLFPNGERYLKTPEQMHRLFADYPEAIARGIEIANQCQFNLDELKYEYPRELTPADKTPLQYLAELTWAGAAERFPDGISPKIKSLLEHELALIEKLKFEAYFLTVHDLVRFARSRGILCQGRGSAANSAVCYCIGVTSVDPTKIDLLFERFVSSARDEPPDIDIDFEHERREEVIQYAYNKYGRERVGMTAEIISYRGRSAVRDVGKALGLGIDAVDQIARRLDWWHSGRLTDAQLAGAGLDPGDRTIRQLISLTGELLGFPRHLSQHVGGLVMTRGALCELVPIENAAMEDRTVIEWDKDDIDALGILKVDVLALGMLTRLSKGMQLINDYRAAGAPLLQLYTIPAEDPAVYEMISDADTVGVFQIESRAQMTMLPRLKPKEFYDLVIEVAIVRPGPIHGDMVHPYLRRRNGEEPVEFPNEALKEALGKTLGVPLFQEQAMKVVMVAAGFSAEEADSLRRAMAAWRYNGKIEQFQDKMIQGMLNNGYTREFSERLFQQIKGFGEYGFPESHAASFALLVYASCWMKRYYPAAFACALLNSQPMGFYAPAQIVRDAREHDVTARSIDVNFSHWDCTLEEGEIGTAGGKTYGKPAKMHPARARVKTMWGTGGPALRLGFRQIKGMRQLHADRVVAVRPAGGFTSIEQFHRLTQLPASAVQRLAEADAFTSLPRSRRSAMWQTLAIDDCAAPLFEQDDLFEPNDIEESADAEESLQIAQIQSIDASDHLLPPMPIGQEVMADYATAGLSLKRHPVSIVRKELAARKISTAAELSRRDKGWIQIAGIVLIRQRPGTASGIVFVTLEDETGIANLIIRPKTYETYRAAARHATLLQADGYIERQGKVIHIMVRHLHDLSHLLSGYAFHSRDFR